ncbi:MAG: VWA domain-containing protein [Planctomycetota bacterium]|jgi:uncharacterized protein YegL|nr:VWA domain-containing protein [Planctomycetota bacterium]
MRKLPVYLLIDISGSMAGEPIEAVKNGLQTMQSALRKDPHALEQAYVSLITFSTAAKQLIPLTEVAKFQIPALSAGGGTALGGALELLVDCVDREVMKSAPDQKGDWKPMVFLMTDGEPTDQIDNGVSAFKAGKWGVVVACAAGAHANIATLQRIAGENVIRLDTADSNSIAAFFKFVSSSISVNSKKADSGAEAGSMSDLPPPPPEISLAKL